jgi:hypothetical protein
LNWVRDRALKVIDFKQITSPLWVRIPPGNSSCEEHIQLVLIDNVIKNKNKDQQGKGNVHSK